MSEDLKQSNSPARARAVRAATDPVLAPVFGPMFVESLERRRLMAAVGTKIGAELAFLANDYVAHPPAVTVAKGVKSAARYHFAAAQPNASLIRTTAQNAVYVKTVAKNKATAGLVTQLKAIGATVSAQYGRVVSALVPMSALAKLDTLSNLNFATPAYTPYTLAGKIDDQGTAALTSDSGSKKFGVDGTGVTVGILSDSYNTQGGAAASVANGDLPTVNVLKEDPTAGTDEGRAMAEIVHDVAPGAGIAFYTGVVGQADFAAGVTKLAQPTASGGGGAKVIVDDIGFFDEPIYQEGIAAQAVNNVATTYGASYFSSAGNSARQAYESGFNAVSATLPAISASAATYHDFDPGAGTDFYQPITLAAGDSFAITYQWDQPYASAGGAGSASTMGAYLINPAKTLVLSSATTSRIGGDPIQILAYTNNTGASNTFYLSLRDIAGAVPGAMKYISLAGGMVTNYLTNTGASFGHNQATGAIGVGAVNYTQTPAFKVSPPVLESFSSAGGTPILFSPSGARLATPDVRQSPAITSVDATATSFFGGGGNDGQQHFVGTSAAASHAAAVAALLLQAKPSLTPSLIRSALTSTAIDMKTVGYDFDSGFGLIQAEAALRSVVGASLSGNVFRDYNNDGVKNGADVSLSGQTVFFDDNTSGTANTGNTTVASSDVPVAIPDGGTPNGNPSRVTSNAVVSGLAGRVTKVTVSLNISHTSASDLGLTLITPSGLRIPLFTNLGGGNGEGTGYNLTLDDSSGSYVQSAPIVTTAVLSGTYIPQSTLSAANGESPNGTWKLEARDYYAGDVGTLNSWSLAVNAAEQTTTTDASGNYAFTGLLPSSVYGQYHVRAAAAGFTASTSPLDLTLALGQSSTGNNIGLVRPLSTISSIVLDSGEIERSNVKQIDVTISGDVSSVAGAFTLTQTSGPVIQAYTVNATKISIGGGVSTLFRLTFTGPGVTSAGSVADGRYTLSIDGSKLTNANGDNVDAAGTFTPGSAQSYLFHRLSGDADGNAVVNFNDFLVLQNAFGQSSGSPSYNVGADHDLNGVVDFNDFLILQNQFGHTV